MKQYDPFKIIYFIKIKNQKYSFSSIHIYENLLPIGPKSGNWKWSSNTSRMYPRDGPKTVTLNRIPCWITQISFGSQRILPNSVVITNAPSWGTINNTVLFFTFFNIEYHKNFHFWNRIIFEIDDKCLIRTSILYFKIWSWRWEMFLNAYKLKKNFR